MEKISQQKISKKDQKNFAQSHKVKMLLFRKIVKNYFSGSTANLGDQQKNLQ